MAWGFRQTNEDGCKVEDWATDQNLMLIHDSELPFNFNGGRWHKGYNPDLVFVTDRISTMSVKEIGNVILNSQQRPILKIIGAIQPTTVPFKRCFNFKRANWDSFSAKIDALPELILPPKDMMSFLTLSKPFQERRYQEAAVQVIFLAYLNSIRTSYLAIMTCTARTPSLWRHYLLGRTCFRTSPAAEGAHGTI